MNIADYPLEIRQQASSENGATTRAATKGRPCDIGRSKLTQSTCISDSIKLWNVAPSAITESTTLYKAKKEIKKFVRTLPI